MLTIIFIAEMIALYLLSRFLNQSIFSFFYRFTHSEHIAITITTLLLFPGTVIHELSHLFIAEILQVRTGKLSLIPEKINEEHIQAGSVEVQKTDPFRRSIIGLAPIFVGVITITLLSIQLTGLIPALTVQLNAFQSTISGTTPFTIYPSTIIFLLLGYLLFAISNNMFSSKEDLEGVPPVIIFFGLVIAASYAVGFRVNLAGNILLFLNTQLSYLTKNLGVVLGINLVLLIILRVLLSFIHPHRH